MTNKKYTYDSYTSLTLGTCLYVQKSSNLLSIKGPSVGQRVARLIKGLITMPQRPKRPCSKPGCRALVESGKGGYCDKHKRECTQSYDYKRGTSAQRGYDANWRKLRKAILAVEPLCRKCLAEGKIKEATEVDHIDGNVRNLERSNLQPLCKSHHSKKTVMESNFGKNEKKGKR